IPRPFKELNSLLSKWMQAEDIHVANLLQWGNTKRFTNTIQYAHGAEGLYHEGDYWLASGQENPRTHFLGHTVTFGARTPINQPDNYLIYRLFWEESRRQKALSGFAHFGVNRGAQDGLAIDVPDDLLTFIEVLQFGKGDYDVWYDVLNMGYRWAPIAGTDYPCAGDRTLPGRERFYTRVEGRLDYESWLDGIRRGRTFVTNGPVLEFKVDGQGMAAALTLDKAGAGLAEATVRFDPARDNVKQLEVIENGTIVRTFFREPKTAEICCQFKHHLPEAAWLAVRASGDKLSAAPSP